MKFFKKILISDNTVQQHLKDCILLFSLLKEGSPGVSLLSHAVYIYSATYHNRNAYKGLYHIIGADEMDYPAVIAF